VQRVNYPPDFNDYLQMSKMAIPILSLSQLSTTVRVAARRKIILILMHLAYILFVLDIFELGTTFLSHDFYLHTLFFTSKFVFTVILLRMPKMVS
jgi:hypothetical protein